MSAMPPVMPTDQVSPRFNSGFDTLPFHSSESIRQASTGRLHCTITSAVDTARNLLYPGRKSKHSSVNHIRLLPHDSSNANMLTASSHHFLRPSSRKSPSTARNIMTAPMYVGPAVPGWSPQYVPSGRSEGRAPKFFRTSATGPSEENCCADDPPLRLGMNMLRLSVRP